MIIEMARLTIDPDRAHDFEQAVAACAPLFREAVGCRSMKLERTVEDPAQYLLRVGWNSLEDHISGFRRSDAFQHWRETAKPFFIEPPEVVHHETTLDLF